MTQPLAIRYGYDDVPTLREFALSDAFIRGVMGPFGSGKSSACVVEIVRRGQAQRPGPDGIRRTRFAVIRNTYSELRETTIKTFFQWFAPIHFGRYVEHKHTYTIKAFAQCEIEVIFLALDRPEDIKKLLSLELTGAWINEAREVPWAIIEAVQGRVGRYPAQRDGGATWYGIWADTNPPDADSKWYKFFEERSWLPGFEALKRDGDLPRDMAPEEFAAIFKQPGGLSDQAENLSNLPGGRRYYVNLKADKSKDWVTVYIDGDYGFVIDGKAVFPEYNDRVHCQSLNPVAGKPIIRGWDFGLTPACSYSQILPGGRWLIFDEMVSDNMGIDRFSDDVLAHSTRCFPMGATFEDYGDPAGEQRAQTDERTCFEIMWAKGIQIEGGEQNLTIRLESVRKPLRTLGPDGEPMLALHPRCKVTRKAFRGGYQYRRMKVSGERYTSAPDKNAYSHIMDGIQYPATRLFGGGLTRQPQDDFDDSDRFDYAADATRSSITGY